MILFALFCISALIGVLLGLWLAAFALSGLHASEDSLESVGGLRVLPSQTLRIVIAYAADNAGRVFAAIRALAFKAWKRRIPETEWALSRKHISFGHADHDLSARARCQGPGVLSEVEGSANL